MTRWQTGKIGGANLKVGELLVYSDSDQDARAPTVIISISNNTLFTRKGPSAYKPCG